MSDINHHLRVIMLLFDSRCLCVKPRAVFSPLRRGNNERKKSVTESERERERDCEALMSCPCSHVASPLRFTCYHCLPRLTFPQ